MNPHQFLLAAGFENRAMAHGHNLEVRTRSSFDSQYGGRVCVLPNKPTKRSSSISMRYAVSFEIGLQTQWNVLPDGPIFNDLDPPLTYIFPTKQIDVYIQVVYCAADIRKASHGPSFRCLAVHCQGRRIEIVTCARTSTHCSEFYHWSQAIQTYFELEF